MKVSLLALTLLFSAFSHSQPPLPSIDSELLPAYESITERAKLHGKDISALMQLHGLQSIELVESLPEGDLAMYRREGNKYYIYIAEKSLINFEALEFIMAHELGHVCKLKHIDEPQDWNTDIMSSSRTIDESHIIHQIMIHPGYSGQIWKQYFDKLK